MPRIFAEKEGDVAMLEVGARRCADHAIADPDFAGLLLGERARSIARPERAPGGGRVGPGQVVRLAATAVVEDRITAEAISHAGEPLRNLTNGGIPIDLFEAAVGFAPQRGRQKIAAVLVIVEPMGLLACIAA